MTAADAARDPHTRAEAEPRLEAVIFDLDGVIVDSEIWWDDVRRDFAAARGMPWSTDDRVAVMGSNSRQWSATMRERLRLEEPIERIEREVVDAVVARYLAEGAPGIPGAVEAVRRVAAAWPVAIASSAHRDVIDAALRGVGLAELLTVVVSSDEVPHGKPQPDVYLEAARRLGVDPRRCLVIEDSLNGVLAGKAAGMTVVLVPNHAVPPAPGAAEAADVVLELLADLDPTALGLGVRGG